MDIVDINTRPKSSTRGEAFIKDSLFEDIEKSIDNFFKERKIPKHCYKLAVIRLLELNTTQSSLEIEILFALICHHYEKQPLVKYGDKGNIVSYVIPWFVIEHSRQLEMLLEGVRDPLFS